MLAAFCSQLSVSEEDSMPHVLASACHSHSVPSLDLVSPGHLIPHMLTFLRPPSPLSLTPFYSFASPMIISMLSLGVWVPPSEPLCFSGSHPSHSSCHQLMGLLRFPSTFLSSPRCSFHLQCSPFLMTIDLRSKSSFFLVTSILWFCTFCAFV